MTRCPRCQRRFPPSGECPAHGKPTAVGEVSGVEPLPDVTAPAGWTLGRMLAIGGTAVVYELQGPTPAVLKWARWRDRDIRARFEVEGDVLRAVGPPSTPALIEQGTIKDWPYVIMEHVTGETLANWMSRNAERGGLGEVIAILTRVASALGALHDAGYVHRDLKPENISITNRGVRLFDFGLAKPMRKPSSNLTQIGTVVGTPHYIAPEQIRGTAVDQRADIYSLGVIAFEMLSGGPPFVGERRAIEYQHQVARPPSVRETRDIPKELDEVLLRCLAKQPDARPNNTVELREALTRALTAAGTLRGVGRSTSSSSPIEPLGRQADVALAWIAGGDSVAVTRAITGVQGIVVRQRGDGIIAAFSATQHEAPLATLLVTARDLVRDRCRIVVHACKALVRRTAQGKLTVYGHDLEQLAWIPSAPFVGILLTSQAAAQVPRSHPAELPGFFRDAESASGNTTDVISEPTLFGRTSLVEQITSTLGATPALINISGPPGSGKSRLLDTLTTRLRATGREVLDLRVRRRFLGDFPDDNRLLQSLGAAEPSEALVAAARRRAILVIDDVDRLSRRLVELLVRDGLPLARILASATPLFEVVGDSAERIAIELPSLSYADASALLREQLRPAHLIPEVLIERLSLRGAGNPRILLALARDMKRRGAVRRHAGSEEWYVAADELDTLLAPPSPAWLAVRALEDVPPEVAAVLRACSALGPRFCAGEVGYVLGVNDAEQRLGFLLSERVAVERSGWYELEDATLQAAIYETVDEREQLHVRALEYWLDHRMANDVGWLSRIAHHAAACDKAPLASACWLPLARIAQRNGEYDQSEQLLARATSALVNAAPAFVREVLVALD